MTRQLTTPPRTPGRASMVRAAIAAIAKSPTFQSAAMEGAQKAGKAIRKAWKDDKKKKKFKKSEGKDHPVQDLGCVDSDHVVLDLTSKKGKSKAYLKRMSRDLVKGVIRQTYQVSGLVDNVAGRQGVEDFAYCGTRQHFITSGGTSYSGKATIPQGLFNILPENMIGSNPQASSFFNGKTATTINFDKLQLIEWGGEVQMLNGTNFAQEVDVYFCQARRTLDQSPRLFWTFSSEPYNTTGAGVNQTLAGQPIGSITGYPSRELYGVKPQQAQQFKEQYKILGVSNYMLAPGALQKMKVRVKYNKTIHKDKVYNAAGDYLPSSVIMMYVVKGQISAVSGALQTGTNQDFPNNTYSATSLRVLASFTYTIKAFKELPQRAANQNILTSTVRDGIANASLSNIDVTDLQSQTLTVLPNV